MMVELKAFETKESHWARMDFESLWDVLYLCVYEYKHKL